MSKELDRVIQTKIDRLYSNNYPQLYFTQLTVILKLLLLKQHYDSKESN